MAEVKWIKIVTDIFDDEKMCAVETQPDGFILEVVWFKILCLAGKCNQDGFLFVSNKFAYTDEMLAKIFRMEIGIVQRALTLFERLGMIEVVDNAYMISNWNFYQNQKGLEDLNKDHAERQRRYRERQKQKLLEQKKESDVTHDVTDTSQSDVISSYSISLSESIKEIIDYLNTKCNKKYTYRNKSYNSKIHARLKEGFTVEDFKTVIDKKYTKWKGTEYEQYLNPDTLFAPSKFEKYLNETEGNSKPKKENQFNQMIHTNYDFDAIERKLLNE